MCIDELEDWRKANGYYIDTHKLGICLRFANGETCVGCGDEINHTPLPERGLERQVSHD